MFTPVSSHHRFLIEAANHDARARKLQRHADAVLHSGAAPRYADVFDLYEEYSAEAEAEAHTASMLFRAAHELAKHERDRRAA